MTSFGRLCQHWTWWWVAYPCWFPLSQPSRRRGPPSRSRRSWWTGRTPGTGAPRRRPPPWSPRPPRWGTAGSSRSSPGWSWVSWAAHWENVNKVRWARPQNYVMFTSAMETVYRIWTEIETVSLRNFVHLWFLFDRICFWWGLFLLH